MKFSNIPFSWLSSNLWTAYRTPSCDAEGDLWNTVYQSYLSSPFPSHATCFIWWLKLQNYFSAAVGHECLNIYWYFATSKFSIDVVIGTPYLLKNEEAFVSNQNSGAVRMKKLITKAAHLILFLIFMLKLFAAWIGGPLHSIILVWIWFLIFCFSVKKSFSLGPHWIG